MMMNLMTILVKKDSISSKIKTVYYVVPASVRAIFIQDFAKGEISYKVKKEPDVFSQTLIICLQRNYGKNINSALLF